MAKIFLLHWQEAESTVLAAQLRRAGHATRVHWKAGEAPSLARFAPDACVISLDRLPSHGRAVADWLVRARRTRAVPLVFCGGTASAVAATREGFPTARFCTATELRSTLASLLAPTPRVSRIKDR